MVETYTEEEIKAGVPQHPYVPPPQPEAPPKSEEVKPKKVSTKTKGAKRKVGRPLGSKNKPKTPKAEATPTPTATKAEPKVEPTVEKRKRGRPKGSVKRKSYDVTIRMAEEKSKGYGIGQTVEATGRTVGNLTSFGSVPQYTPPNFAIEASKYRPMTPISIESGKYTPHHYQYFNMGSGMPPMGSYFKPSGYVPPPEYKTVLYNKSKSSAVSTSRKKKSKEPRMAIGV